MRCKVVLATLLSGLLLACGGEGSTDAGPLGGEWNVSISPANLTLSQGQTGTVTVSILGKPKGPVSLSVLGVPDSIFATLSSATLSNSGATTTLTIRASLTVSVGTFNIRVHGVDGSSDFSEPSLAVTITLAPGLTVNKAGSGSGTVTSDPAGINCGGACFKQFPSGTPITLTAAPAAGSAFVSWAGGCTGTALTCTMATLGTFGASVTATFNTTAPGMALSVAPSPVTVQQGTSGTANVTVTRINGFAAPVTLTTNAPSGLTVSANPASVTGTTSTLTISAGPSLPVGNYPVTITATGTGVTQQTVTLPVLVTPASQGAAITFNFASCETSEIPVWLAYQNGTGPWTRITPANNAFTLTPGATGGVALVTQGGGETHTEVLYASGNELTSLALAGFCTYTAPTGTKRLTGAIGGGGNASQGFVTRVIFGGSVFTRTQDIMNNFTLTDVPKGPRDLVGSRQPPLNLSLNNKMIVRRGTNYSNGTNIPMVDFGSVESFVPTTGSVTISPFTDSVDFEVGLITANGGSASYYIGKGVSTGASGGMRATFFGLPDSLLQPTDFHGISLATGSGTSFRIIEMISHAMSAQFAMFGPPLGSATKPTTIGTTPYLRLRAQIPTLATYTSVGYVELAQNTNSVSVVMTTAYVGSTPTTWTVDVPDLSGAGYDTRWALQNGTGVSWALAAGSARNGNLLPFLGGAPADFAQLTVAGIADSSASFSASSRSLVRRRPRP